MVGAIEVMAIALGLDFVYTGLTGDCPLYRKLGLSTANHTETSVGTGGKKMA